VVPHPFSHQLCTYRCSAATDLVVPRARWVLLMGRHRGVLVSPILSLMPRTCFLISALDRAPTDPVVPRPVAPQMEASPEHVSSRAGGVFAERLCALTPLSNVWKGTWAAFLSPIDEVGKARLVSLKVRRPYMGISGEPFKLRVRRSCAYLASSRVCRGAVEKEEDRRVGSGGKQPAWVQTSHMVGSACLKDY
jgi:hypothetical protein